ncbi:DMT family transporter, partial [Escherichia coli]|nr:DMT family transporter [Escherichia coli]
GIQPILTAALLVAFVREEFKPSQWLGLALGFVGIAMVLMGKMEWQSEQHKVLAIGLCLLALAGITLGTLYQKKHCQQVDMVGG